VGKKKGDVLVKGESIRSQKKPDKPKRGFFKEELLRKDGKRRVQEDLGGKTKTANKDGETIGKRRIRF